MAWYNICDARAEDLADVMEVVLDEGAFMPTRAHADDAGLDLRCMEAVPVPAGGSAVARTGVHVRIPPGCCGLLVSKSGLNVHDGVTTTGLIDEGFTGEILVRVHNGGRSAKFFRRGDKVSQLVVLPCLRPEPVKVEALPPTERGDAGYGSTGR